MKFDFKLHTKVKIKELNIIGRIKAIYIDTDGVQYSVRYFKDADVKSTYFFVDELEVVEKDQKKELGFTGK